MEGVLKTTVQTQTKTHTKLNTKTDTHTHSTLTTMENAAHTVQLSVAGGSLAGREVSHWHTNTQRIIRTAHGNIHHTGGMTTRLLKASEGKFGDVALTPSSVHFLLARNLFYNSFCRKKICEMDRKKEECIRKQDSVFCHRLHASRSCHTNQFSAAFHATLQM